MRWVCSSSIAIRLTCRDVLTLACAHIHSIWCWHKAWTLLSIFSLCVLLHTAPSAAEIPMHRIFSIHSCGGMPAVQHLQLHRIVLFSLPASSRANAITGAAQGCSGPLQQQNTDGITKWVHTHFQKLAEQAAEHDMCPLSKATCCLCASFGNNHARLAR